MCVEERVKVDMYDWLGVCRGEGESGYVWLVGGV